MTAALVPSFDGIRNFRDIGGCQGRDGRDVRRGLVFRSGHLGRATDRDLQRLEQLGLRTVVDLRSADEVAIEGADPALDGARLISLSMSDPASGLRLRNLIGSGDEAAIVGLLGNGQAERMLIRGYADEVVQRTEVHRRLLDHLSEADGVPALIHCAAGKDRAGWAAAVVLLALGVSEDAIMQDYLLSNAPGSRYEMDPEAGGAAMAPLVRDAIQPLLEVRAEYLQSAFDAVHAHYTDVSRYLEVGLGLTARRRRRLEALLLMP